MMAENNRIIVNRDADLEPFRINISRGAGRFECPWRKWKTPDVLTLLHWKFAEKDNSNIPEKADVDKILPVLEVDEKKLINPPKDKIQVTWIGHATLLVQFDGITILTDPAFSTYCGPSFSTPFGFGYKRYREAACKVKHIPGVDFVIVSNDHFDHLDEQSAEDIKQHFPKAKWFIGNRGGDLIPGMNENITEMNWWEEKNITNNEKSFKFVCTPAQHWCRRSAFDLNKRLWCSWVIQGPTKNFFFAGDTGYYRPVFEKIGEKYGPFSVSAIPIGCYEPNHVLEYQHVSPEEAAQIHKDIKSKQSIAMLWGSFPMTNEFYLEPPQKLEECMGKERDRFISLQHGETWVVGGKRDRPLFMDYGRHASNLGNTESSTEHTSEEIPEAYLGETISVRHMENFTGEEIRAEYLGETLSGRYAENEDRGVMQTNDNIPAGYVGETISGRYAENGEDGVTQNDEEIPAGFLGETISGRYTDN